MSRKSFDTVSGASGRTSKGISRLDQERIEAQRIAEFRSAIGCRVLVQGGRITLEGKRAGILPHMLKTDEPYPDLSIPMSRLKGEQEHSGGYSFGERNGA